MSYMKMVWVPCIAMVLAQGFGGGTLQAQTAGGALALERLRDGEIAQALAAVAPAADERTVIPEVESDPFLRSAAGGLYRALTQEDAAVRYELLSKWVLPEEDRKQIRSLTTIVPQDAPPRAFARLIGERPRDTTFAVADVNGVRGLFSTSWILVTSADEAGVLRRLLTDLERLNGENVDGAATLLLLARIVDSRSDDAALETQIRQRIDGAAPVAVGDAAPVGIRGEDLVVAAACMKRMALRGTAEQLLEKLVTQTLGRPSPYLRPFLRVAHATAVQLHRGESAPQVLWENRLKYWIPVSGRTALSSANGAVGTMWLTHEDHILHLAGSGYDQLLFRYPLAGQCGVYCETQEGGDIGTDGGLVFGGLNFEALGSTSRLTVTDADSGHAVYRPCPFMRHEQRPVFNRVSIETRSAEGDSPAAARFLANLHPMWADEIWSGSPWAGLRADAQHRPVFRNVKITGEPVIPREVQLASGRQLRGWMSGFYGETQPSFHDGGTLSIERGTVSAAVEKAADASSGTPEAATPTDWRIEDGVISAMKHDAEEGRTAQSVLRYQRPLLDGESVSYEFRYVQNEVEVHPALGRLAFLIDTSGVRIHWMTDGEREWSGLPEDNVTLEPLSRRGGREVPLRDGGWNAVTLARAEGKVQLTLNDTLVYEREIDFSGDLLFGLYRDRTKHAVNVRNVIMRGDWPESIPEDCLQNPVVVGEKTQAAVDRGVASDVVGFDVVSQNVAGVQLRASQLPPADRYQALLDWVMPDDGDTRFRMAGHFRPASPPPEGLVDLIETGNLKPSRPLPASRGQGPRLFNKQFQAGDAELVSPVFDLLDTAAELGRLDELQAETASHPESRERDALLALVESERGQRSAADEAVLRVLKSLQGASPASLDEVWPETLVAWRSIMKYGTSESIGELLGGIHQQYTLKNQPVGVEFYHTHIAALMERYAVLAGNSESTWEESRDVPADWISAVRSRAASRGQGAAPAVWRMMAGPEMLHVSGHQEEFLLYRYPLRGNIEVSGRIRGYGTTEALFGGQFTAPSWSPEQLNTGNFRLGTYSREKIDPPFSRPDAWLHFRAVVDRDVCSVWINGRIVRSEVLPEEWSPWIGAHVWYRNAGRIRDVSISGDPVIPEQVTLSADPGMSDWLPYYQDPKGQPPCWSYSTDTDAKGVIRGRRRELLTGSSVESLLTHLRPLGDDEEIEYHFLCEEGALHCHPALDRVAFLLLPDGVRLHWITDGEYDTTPVPPDNQFSRGVQIGDAVPLRDGDWNQLKLRITGNTARIHVNGELVYELPLDSVGAGIGRTFGLFHFSDEAALQVRDVVLRGDWPKQVPVLEEQTLADQTVVKLDRDREHLPTVFHHDFARRGLDSEYFTVRDTKGGGTIVKRADGLRMVRPALNGWTSTELQSRVVVRGDFDVEVQFDQFEYSGDQDAAVMVLVKLDDEQQNMVRAVRNSVGHVGRQYFQVSRSIIHPDGKRGYQSENVTWEATSGRMRLARRGDTVYYLFADGATKQYVLAGSEVVTDRDSTGIDLNVIANGTAVAGVVWKNLTIAAEELLLLPDPSDQPANEIFVMNADGTGLHSVTGHDPGLNGAGSPDWSPDGKQLAFDIYSGTNRGNFLINADGGGLKSLGTGCMPTFGPDGKRLAFTWSGQGMALMDSNGENREVIAADGWGAQFSPNGRSIAFQAYEQTGQGRSVNIAVVDIETRERKVVLEGEHAQKYSQIYWNMEWSPDGRQICFMGDLRSGNGAEVAIVSTAGSSSGLRVVTTEPASTDFGWHPDGSRILLAKHSPHHRGVRLFVCDLSTGEIALLETQPLDMPNHSGVWSPDGGRIAFVSRRTPQPVAWKPGTDQ